MINYFLILFTKEKSILIKNKRINLFFKSDKKIIDEKRINSTSSHILKHYTNYQSS